MAPRICLLACCQQVRAKVIGAGNGLARTKRIGAEQKVPPDVCALGLKDCPRQSNWRMTNAPVDLARNRNVAVHKRTTFLIPSIFQSSLQWEPVQGNRIASFLYSLTFVPSAVYCPRHINWRRKSDGTRQQIWRGIELRTSSRASNFLDSFPFSLFVAGESLLSLYSLQGNLCR